MTPATSGGFAAVEFGRDVVGVEPYPWQRFLLIHALERLPSGRFRFRTVLILVARQNGKTSIIEVKNLWKMFVLGLPLVIGTAQNLDISEESWDRAVEIAESVPDLAAEIVHVDRTNGKKALRLANGSRWKIAAASRRGGRGLSGDDVNLDELREHHTWEAWAAVTKTTMARPAAQVYAFSNAGDDRSVVLNALQAQARAAAAAGPAAQDLSLGLFEWSVPDDVRCTCLRGDGQPHGTGCQLRDRRLWAMANPSLGYGITVQALESALSTDPTEVFLTECLCQRVPTLTPKWRVLSEAEWTAWADRSGDRPPAVAFAAQVAHDRSRSTIAACGVLPGGPALVTIVDQRPGTAWVPGRLVELRDRYRPVAIAVQDKGPAGALGPDLAAAGLRPPDNPERPRAGELAVPWASDVAAGYGMFVDALREGRLRHDDSAPLNVAIAEADTRPLGTATAWAYRAEGADAVEAATLAHWAWVTRSPLVLAQRAPKIW